MFRFGHLHSTALGGFLFMMFIAVIVFGIASLIKGDSKV